MCVCVCLSLLFLFCWKWCEERTLRTPCADVFMDSRLKIVGTIRGVVHCQLDSLDYFILPCPPRADRGERLTLFFSPSFSPPTQCFLRQNINTYSQSHTMFAATNVQQTAFVGKAVAMKSRTMVRYESVVGYVRVVVYCFLSGV